MGDIDKAYKNIFTHAQVVRELLQSFVKEAISYTEKTFFLLLFSSFKISHPLSSFSGTPRGVSISVGENPTRQLTIRTVVKGIVFRGRLLVARLIAKFPVASKQTVMLRREHTSFVKSLRLMSLSEKVKSGNAYVKWKIVESMCNRRSYE